MDVLNRMEKLCAIPGVSGWEDPVRDEILCQLGDVCDCTVDALGNVIVHKKGKVAPKQRIMLSAHMDEVGFIITGIEPSGLLRFAAVGGIDSRVVVGKPVEVGKGGIYGVIGTKAVHLQEEKERGEPQKLDKLFIDIGAADADEARKHVNPGDRAVFSTPYGRLGEERIFGRAMDDRAGCALLIELLHRELACDCSVVFTVQEEVGSAGARAAANALRPDIAVIVETTTASDIAGVEPDKQVCRQGEGPVISFMDRGAIYDRRLYQLALDCAQSRQIPVQSKLGVYGGNESKMIQTAADGVRVMAVSLPCRYIHSPTNMLHQEDVFSTLRLLEVLLEDLAGV